MIHDLMRFWEIKVICGATGILETATNILLVTLCFCLEIVYKIGFQQSRKYFSIFLC